MDAVRIGNRCVGDGEPCYVIAEAGVNHDGDLEAALALVDAAVAAGADAVKFQTFVADELASPSAPKAAYQEETVGAAGSQLDMLRSLQLEREAFGHIRDRCRDRGIEFLSTPFDEPSLELLLGLGVPALKVGSGDVTNLPFLERIGASGLPVVLSTGMSTLDEVRAAVAALGDIDVVVLHCVSRYPTPPEIVNLRAMATLREALDVPVGFSDHTEGVDTAIAAVALGASVLEKHLTLDRARSGPDHRASLDPEQFTRYIATVRTVERALGDGEKVPAPGEAEVASVARKSVVIVRDLEAGHVLTADDLAVRRPGTGLPPAAVRELPGRVLARPLRAGEVLEASALQ